MKYTQENYAAVLKKIRNCSTFRINKRLTAKVTSECVALYKKAFPRKRRKDHCDYEHDARHAFWDEVVIKYRPMIDRINRLVDCYQDAWDAWLDAASNVLSPAQTKDTSVLYSVTDGSYSSQGWGARKYASGDAKSHMISWQATHPNLTFEFSEVFHKYDSPVRTMGGETYKGYYEYQVLVNTDEVGCSIIKRSKVSAKEHYRALLRAGCNPKVSNPWLPASFPESWGMDWYGNDLKTADENSAVGA